MPLPSNIAQSFLNVDWQMDAGYPLAGLGWVGVAGDVSPDQDFWRFLLEERDGQCQIPKTYD
jgi:hypothetical protein